MNNLSNERASDKDIQQIIDSKEKGTAMFMPVDVYYLIAKELKALREAGKEPVAWTDKEELRDAGNGGCGYLFSLNGNANKFSDPRRKIMLYAAPQLPAVPYGWVMVPKEPTDEMNKVGWLSMNEHDAINPTWRAMIAAAPKPEA